MVGIIHPCKIYGAMAAARPILFLGPNPSHISDLLETSPHRHPNPPRRPPLRRRRHPPPPRNPRRPITIDGPNRPNDPGTIPQPIPSLRPTLRFRRKNNAHRPPSKYLAAGAQHRGFPPPLPANFATSWKRQCKSPPLQIIRSFSTTPYRPADISRQGFWHRCHQGPRYM